MCGLSELRIRRAAGENATIDLSEQIGSGQLWGVAVVLALGIGVLTLIMLAHGPFLPHMFFGWCIVFPIMLIGSLGIQRKKRNETSPYISFPRWKR